MLKTGMALFPTAQLVSIFPIDLSTLLIKFSVYSAMTLSYFLECFFGDDLSFKDFSFLDFSMLIPFISFVV